MAQSVEGLRRALVAATVGLLTSCSYTSTMVLRNDTQHPLTPYPMVEEPAPPHREADPLLVPVHGFRAIDKTGLDPVFYSPNVLNPDLPNALFLGVDRSDARPPVLQWRLMHCVVAPGKEGSDPTLQPVLVEEQTVELPDEDVVVRLYFGPSDADPTARWRVSVEPSAH